MNYKCKTCNKEVDSFIAIYCTDCKVYFCDMDCYDEHMIGALMGGVTSPLEEIKYIN